VHGAAQLRVGCACALLAWQVFDPDGTGVMDMGVLKSILAKMPGVGDISQDVRGPRSHPRAAPLADPWSIDEAFENINDEVRGHHRRHSFVWRVLWRPLLRMAGRIYVEATPECRHPSPQSVCTLL